jgi:tetratricopeptide (TPR) repeat protein
VTGRDVKRAAAFLGVALLFTDGSAFAQTCPMPNAPPSKALSGRDRRRLRAAPRNARLLDAEIRGLTALLQSTPPDSPDRIQELRRLAEDCAEEESAHLQTKARLDLEPATVDGSNAALARQEGASAQRARTSALGFYVTLTTQYPSYPKLDEALYYLAYEYELDGQTANARKTYYSLIQSQPSSPFIPNAYLGFAEIFFDEASAGDPSKWPLAKQAYMKVVDFPPPANTVYGYAWFKLAHVFWRSAEPSMAASSFQKAAEWATAFPQDANARTVMAAAKTDRAALERACPALAGP